MYFVMEKWVIHFNGNVRDTYRQPRSIIKDEKVIEDKNKIIELMYSINDYITMSDDDIEKVYVSWGMKEGRMYIGFYSERRDELDDIWFDEYFELYGVVL